MIDRIANRLVGDGDSSEIRNFTWNMIGSLATAASSMILSLFVIRIIGPEEGGVFAIALTLSQMLMYISYFEMRTFQVTDPAKRYLFGEYHSTKIFLCIIMILVSAVYVGIKHYDLKKALITLLVCLWKDIDGYADVYESQFQVDGRLDLSGKSMAYRMFFAVVVFFVILLVTGNLIISLIAVNIAAIMGVAIFNIAVMRITGEIAVSVNIDRIKQIIKECFPLFVGVFCWVYILSASRIAIDNNMSSFYQSYYQILFLPVSVINLFAGFVFKPLLPRLAVYYETNKKKEFYGIILKGILCLLCITVICVLGAYLLGVPVLSFLSGCDLTSYKWLLIFLIISGGLNAIAFTLYYVLTILRAMDAILFDYIISAVIAFFISNYLVKQFGMWGAAESYFIVNIVLCFLFAVSILTKGNKK